MGLKKFDVTFHLYRRDHVLSMHATCTVEAKSQRIVDLFPVIYARIKEDVPGINETDYPTLNLLYVHEHQYSDMSAYEQGIYDARQGSNDVMDNPYVGVTTDHECADAWRKGFVEEHERIHGAKND